MRPSRRGRIAEPVAALCTLLLFLGCSMVEAQQRRPARPAVRRPPATRRAALPPPPQPAMPPAVPEDDAPRQRPPIQPARLSNGLTLLCRANDASDIVSVVALVRAGLPDEREEQAGLAALTAECLVRGTTTRAGPAFEAAVRRAGGNLTVTPGYDFTEVAVVTSRVQFEAALKLVADVLAHPRFEGEEVRQVRQMLRERAARLDREFSSASYQALTAQLYPRSPYGRPLYGYADTLERLTENDVRRFWEQTYVQNRMTVAVVGNVDARRALVLAGKAFEDLPFRADATTPRPTIEPLARTRVEVLQRPGGAAQLTAGFLLPGATRENYPVMALLSTVLGGGKQARLFANIRGKQGIGYELGTFYEPLIYQSHLVAYVVTPQFRARRGREEGESLLDRVRELFLAELRALASGPITDAELARARAFLIGRQALRQERSRDQAKWLAWNEAMGLGRDWDDRFAARVQAITKEQVQEAAKRLSGNYALVVTVPTPE